jgi:predicted nuclease of restriction endonuclease-like (RecB) superfamily
VNSTLTGYADFLSDVKARVQGAQVRAALAVNSELVLLYWNIGADISRRMQQHGWGSKVVDQLAADLRREFPDMHGFSPRNLRYMRSFADAWTDEAILQGLLAKITWYHNLTLLEKVKEPAQRLWYAQQTIENGWSRPILLHQIESRLHERLGSAQTNFAHTLPAPQSDLAQNLLKDPYNFDFLTLGREAEERDIERGLVVHIRDFLLELGVGFAFVGTQYHLDVAGQDWYLDMLFYHLNLRCYVVVELKATDFKPEYAGKMQFYLSAVDDTLRRGDDAPSIGLILCRTKNRTVVEYTLRDTTRPIGVSQFQITEALPETLKGSLPTIEQLEAELTLRETDEESSNEASAHE